MAAIICASFGAVIVGAVIVGAAIVSIIGAANYLYSVQLQRWPFCVSGAFLGIAAMSVKYRISLAIATTVILSIVASISGLAIEYMIGSAPGPMTDARIFVLYTPTFANGFLAILVPVFHRPFHECRSCSWGLTLNTGRSRTDTRGGSRTVERLSFLVTGLQRSRRARNLRSLSALKPLLPIGSLP